MASSKSRLGRGLGGLIAGGMGNNKGSAAASKAPAAKSTTAPAATPATTAPAKSSSAPAKPAAASTSVATTPATTSATAPVETKVTANVAATSPAEQVTESNGITQEVGIQQIEPNPYQPRKEFEPEKLSELAESIRAEGLLQPILVRQVGDRYQIIAGERRWRACQSIGMKRVPVRVVKSSDTSSAVMSLIENLQREDLNPIEEALGFARLIAEFKLTQEAVATRVGRARASVANSLRLLQLDEEIRGYLSRDLLSVGHAKVLLGVADPARRLLLARRIIQEGWSVREAEKRMKSVKEGNEENPAEKSRSAVPQETQAIQDLEKRLTSHLNTPVAFKHSPKKGRIVIEYFGNEDLQRILEAIGVPG